MAYDVATEAENNTLVVREHELARDKPESGVDMAFDALMDLEENSDLSNFMKNFDEGSGDFLDLWSSLDSSLACTNKATAEVLRYMVHKKCEIK